MSCEDDAFFDHMWTCRENYRKLAQCEMGVASLMRTSSVLDIGCGVGHGVAYFQEELPEAHVTGWDLELAVTHAHRRYPKNRFLTFDLDTRTDPVDLVICTETAEHLPESDADHFVNCVTAAVGRELIWSAAPPGQNWEGHINLQHAPYWLAKLEARGLVVDWRSTGELRARMLEMHAQHEFCCSNFVYLRRP